MLKIVLICISVQFFSEKSSQQKWQKINQIFTYILKSFIFSKKIALKESNKDQRVENILNIHKIMFEVSKSQALEATASKCKCPI